MSATRKRSLIVHRPAARGWRPQCARSPYAAPDRASTTTIPSHASPKARTRPRSKPWDIGLLYELAINLAVATRHEPSNTRAGNVNTIDEVPDSSWFTNRIGARPLTADEIARGPNSVRRRRQTSG